MVFVLTEVLTLQPYNTLVFLLLTVWDSVNLVKFSLILPENFQR
jgi:hypothetical protein